MNEHGGQPDRLTVGVGPVWLWAAVLAAALVGWVATLLADPPAAWGGALVGFMFFVPLSAGMVVWPAIVIISRGRWMGPAARVALAGLYFIPVAAAVFLALFVGRWSWARWMHADIGDKAAWLNVPFLFARDAAALLALWAVQWLFYRRATRPSRPGRNLGVLAAWLVLLYCLVFSLLGFDLVMALDGHWYSALFGGYVFVTGAYAALAMWTLLALLGRPALDQSRRNDLGQLLIAFALLSAYMMYSQLIVIWYENLPEEAAFVVPRFSDPASPWRLVSVALLGTIYLGPLVLLLARRARASRWFLASVCVLVLGGLWVERCWLIVPALHGGAGMLLAGLAMLGAMLALFMIGVMLFERFGPPWRAAEGRPAPADAGRDDPAAAEGARP